MGWLSSLKEWATREPVAHVDDRLLGPLILEENCWEAKVFANGRTVSFSIGGRYEPDPYLIARARDILASFDQFTEDVAAFLEDEAKKDGWASFADEILALVIRDICLFWPRHPEEGMIFFEGPDECMHWRCYLIGRSPVNLNFDR